MRFITIQEEWAGDLAAAPTTSLFGPKVSGAIDVTISLTRQRDQQTAVFLRIVYQQMNHN
jgi:hypothetical protein